MNIRVIETIRELQDLADAERAAGRKISLVPTMGALHRGHLALVETGRERADRVWVSIFVNPLQFGAGEDFERYPRRPEADAELLATAGADPWVPALVLFTWNLFSRGCWLVS